MPSDFRYREVFLRGKPERPARHPAMDTGHRAKIFAPFAALKGFDEAVASKDVLYTDRIQPGETDQEELSQKLSVLRGLTCHGRVARENAPVAEVTFYVPCADKNSAAYGRRGQFRTVRDVVWNVDPVQKTVLVGKTLIPIRDIISIEAKNLFDVEWELDAP